MKIRVFELVLQMFEVSSNWNVADRNEDLLEIRTSEEGELGDRCEVYFHLEEIRAVAGQVPVVVGEEEEGVLVYLVAVPGVNLALDEFFLDGVELVVRVLTDGFGEVADEEVPVDDELTMPPWSDFLIPEELIILHID